MKLFLEPNAAATVFMKALRSSIVHYRSPDTVSVYATEVIDNNDPRANILQMKQAKRAEVDELLRRGTFKVVPRSELTNSANVLTARFVLAIKSNTDGNIKYKARYVMWSKRHDEELPRSCSSKVKSIFGKSTFSTGFNVWI